MSERKFWIRRRRDVYFFSGLIITCMFGSMVSSYWHYLDRTAVHRHINIKKTPAPAARVRKLREVQYTPAKIKVGTTQYYHLDEGPAPETPPALEENGNK